jgi:hypothetical protein
VRDNSASIFPAAPKFFRNFLNLHIALFKQNKFRIKQNISEHLTPEDTVTPPTKDRILPGAEHSQAAGSVVFPTTFENVILWAEFP